MAMLSRLNWPHVVQHVMSFEIWSPEHTKVLLENAQKVAVAVDAGIFWPDIFNEVAARCKMWGRIGITGIDLDAIGQQTLRGRLAGRVFDGKISLNNAQVGPYLAIDPEQMDKWADLVTEELRHVLEEHKKQGVRPYSHLFLDKHGDIGYFRSANGLVASELERRQWDHMLRVLRRRISPVAKEYGMEIIENGPVTDARDFIQGRMFENVPHSPDWRHEIFGSPDGFGIRDEARHWQVSIGENGEGYREACVALSMLWDCDFAPRMKVSEPKELFSGQVGEWQPVSGFHGDCRFIPDKTGWQRQFYSRRQCKEAWCKAVFTHDWRIAEIVLPWKQM